MTKNSLGKSIISSGGNLLEFKDSSSGDIPVVLFNGFRMELDNWNEIFSELSRHARVVTYNRLGVGKSSKAKRAQTGREVIEDFRTFANHIKLSPPYLLVAHSLGGLFANLYARLYPQEISGVIFVDSPHPAEIAAQRQIKPPRLLSLINNAFKCIEIKFDRFKYSEDEEVMQTVAQIFAAGYFPQVPITLITGTQKMPFVPQESFATHIKYQRDLAAISPNSRSVNADKSGHFPQITQPEIVLAKIKNMIARLT